MRAYLGFMNLAWGLAVLLSFLLLELLLEGANFHFLFCLDVLEVDFVHLDHLEFPLEDLVLVFEDGDGLLLLVEVLPDGFVFLLEVVDFDDVVFGVD